MEEKQQSIRYVMVSPESVQSSGSNDEIDLRELWSAIWVGKWIIIAITSIFAIASVLYALSLPNIYKSEALLAPAESDQQAGLGGLTGQLGGLASLAGVNLGGAKTDKTAMAIEILKSREFFAKFAEKHNIFPDLMAVKGWEIASNKVVYNDDIYDAQNGNWLREVKAPKKSEPSMQEAKRVFDGALNIDKSADSGMVIITMEHYSPYVAKEWVDWLIQDINSVMKNRDKEEAEKSIAYLQSEVTKTNIVEQKTLLYQLIEEQAKILMFAEVRDEYVFKTIDPAFVPELKFKPQRPLIVILGVLLGGFLALLFVFFTTLNNSKNIQKSE